MSMFHENFLLKQIKFYCYFHSRFLGNWAMGVKNDDYILNSLSESVASLSNTRETNRHLVYTEIPSLSVLDII